MKELALMPFIGRQAIIARPLRFELERNTSPSQLLRRQKLTLTCRITAISLPGQLI